MIKSLEGAQMSRWPRRAGFLQRLGPGPRRAAHLLAALPLPLQRGPGTGSVASRGLSPGHSPCAASAGPSLHTSRLIPRSGVARRPSGVRPPLALCKILSWKRLLVFEVVEVKPNALFRSGKMACIYLTYLFHFSDDVFLPKDIDLDSVDMDETEREVEYFKR